MNLFSLNHIRLLSIAFGLLGCLLLSSCGSMDEEHDHIDIADTVEGAGIVSAEELSEFMGNGTMYTATLLAPIDLGNDMINLSAQRGNVIIDGNGFAITGSGACVIRLEDGAAITLNNVTIESYSADAIGCLGSAEIGGDATIIAEGNAIHSKGLITIAKNSSLTLTAAGGCGITASGLTLDAGARINAKAGLNAVITKKSELTLMHDSVLTASTSDNYNAVKCADTLVMYDGAAFSAENDGDYHGAELDSLTVDGAVTINAVGGSKGMGMFIFTQQEDICVIGSCTPEAQYENGRGSITFVEDKAAYEAYMAASVEEDEEEQDDAGQADMPADE